MDLIQILKVLGDLSNGGGPRILSSSENSRNPKNNVFCTEALGGKVQGTKT